MTEPKPTPEPTEADVERANAFFRWLAKARNTDDSEDDLELATEFARVRLEVLEALAKHFEALGRRACAFTEPMDETACGYAAAIARDFVNVLRERGDS